MRVVGQGEVFLYPSMAKKLLDDYLRRLDAGSQIESLLSQREKEIMRLLVEGYSNKEIAASLVVSLSTVHTHRGNLMRKLGLSSQHELVQFAREHGLTI